MQTKTLAIVGAIIALAAVLTVGILRSEPGGTAPAGNEPVDLLDYPRGPHGARLLSDDGLRVEMTIYETGVPPHFRIYPYDGAGAPVAPREVELSIELHRVGGRVDPMTFTPEADYLRSNEVVEEPHSFDVKVAARRGGRQSTWSYAQIEGKVQLGADQVRSAGIEILAVGPRRMQTTLELPGEIKADATREAHVVPRLAGVVLEVRKQAGDRVQRGEVMAVISSRELADAKSALIEASHRREFARVALEREESLWRKKISAERDFLAAKRDAEEAVLAEDTAAQKLLALGLPSASLTDLAAQPRDGLSRFEIRAPLTGTVVERDVTTGEAVTAEQAIFTVADFSSVWIELSVYARDLGAVRIGQNATVVSSDLGKEATGTINFIGRLVGEATRSAPARLVLRNPTGEWRPGLFVTVRLVREEVEVPLAVSSEAIQAFRDWQVVFVNYGDWFEARPLELGRTDGQWVEVRSGLKAGDRYAARNSFAVKAEIGKLGATHDH